MEDLEFYKKDDARKFPLITIATLGNDKTISFAVKELKKYLKKIDENSFIDITVFDSYNNDENFIWVGTSSDFEGRLPKVEDPKVDDGIHIDVTDFKGIITATNPRAVLIATYRFLRELGVAFIRPTDDGEVIPKFTLDKCEVKVTETPSYRHRAICIEGANGEEHVRSMIDWIPKAGMNAYYIQFSNPYVFFVRWYEHWHNPTIAKSPIDSSYGKYFKKEMEEEISLRSLLLHDVGHGWTCDKFGFDTIAWGKADDSEITDEHRSYIALVNGKRGFFQDCPMMTEFCYSNEKATNFLTDTVVEYCLEHPDVSYIHFWLSDGFNNCCECDDCKDKNHADQYIELLNLLDKKLDEKGLDTKVVFLIYCNLLWAPKSEKLNNKDRFILMFAPISRSYYDDFSMVDVSSDEVIEEYERNKMTQPNSVNKFLTMYKKWAEKTKVEDSFDFDYHLWYAHFGDPGYYGISKILANDVKTLEELGFNGLISCQLQRVSFPTNLPMHTMATYLWDKNTDFDKMTQDYMKSAFGKHYLVATEYLKELTALIGKGYLVGSEKFSKMSNEELIENYEKAVVVAQNFKKTFADIYENSTFEHEAHKKSFEYLTYHTKIAEYQAKALIERIKNKESEEHKKVCDEIKLFAQLNEEHLHKVLDVWHFVRFVDLRL